MHENILPYEKEGQELLKLLIDIFNNDRKKYITVLSMVSDYEEDVKDLLNYIKTGDNITQKTVTEYAAGISNWREEYY